jgi:hypothetical protein
MSKAIEWEMNDMRRAIALVAYLGMAGCATSASPAAAPEATSVDELSAPLAQPAARIGQPPTPEMLQAALSNNREAMSKAVVAAAACTGNVTCPGYGSCTVWSAPVYCDTVCSSRVCSHVPGEPAEVFGSDIYDSYRICFNPQQQACTEWNESVHTFCGC